MAAKKKKEEAVVIQALDIRVMEVPIVGLSELIMHRWSEKAKSMMLRKQKGEPVRKVPKVPEEDYEATIYRFEDGRIGFPAGAFKVAMVDACRDFDNIPMVRARVLFFVLGEPGKDGVDLVEIHGEPRMREDMVRLESGVADIRHRAGFPQWRATLRIRYNAKVITPALLVNIVNVAGLYGIGGWRPSAPKSKSGSFGMFEVIPTSEEEAEG